jgi:hypothetical protein
MFKRMMEVFEEAEVFNEEERMYARLRLIDYFEHYPWAQGGSWLVVAYVSHAGHTEGVVDV